MSLHFARQETYWVYIYAATIGMLMKGVLVFDNFQQEVDHKKCYYRLLDILLKYEIHIFYNLIKQLYV